MELATPVVELGVEPDMELAAPVVEPDVEPDMELVPVVETVSVTVL